ncbi:MAG: hypothetical protein Q4D17_04295 [Planctomycetia bacterium]|nr:hypothetical protein [Planctomycetia bacterium]
MFKELRKAKERRKRPRKPFVFDFLYHIKKMAFSQVLKREFVKISGKKEEISGFGGGMVPIVREKWLLFKNLSKFLKKPKNTLDRVSLWIKIK